MPRKQLDSQHSCLAFQVRVKRSVVDAGQLQPAYAYAFAYEVNTGDLWVWFPRESARREIQPWR